MALPQRYVEKDSYTEDEYLTWEADALCKSEYVWGERDTRNVRRHA